jgi:hypothetical protein
MRTSALRIVLVLGLAGALFTGPACSSDEDDGSSSGGSAGTGGKGGTGGTGGKSGTGGSSGSGGTGGGLAPAVCAGVTCEAGPTVASVGVEVPTCCSTADKCGLDTSLLSSVGITFNQVCEERNQPGDANSACPESPPIDVSAGFVIQPFQGCCRPEGKCGHLLNVADVTGIGQVELKLGCVDTEGVLPEAGAPPTCTPGGGGGGAAGAAGAAN